MHQSHRFLPLVTALFAFSGNALANETILLSESDFFVDIPEVTSATRMPQKLSEAPASMTVIDRTMIEASGLQTIPDLLRLVPGFQSYSINANTLGTTYHGASDDFPNRLEVMVDGRSVYLPLLSAVAWNTLGISLDDIERIEVVRGSNVPAQGSNAFFGSIDIITREPTAKYADAGAVVALYSDTDDIARQAAEMLTAMDGQLPPPAWPREFSITVNRTAARNLDLVLPPAERLVEQLKAQEAP